jgi:hypothetical protein
MDAIKDGDLIPCQPITCPHLRRVARFDISVPDLELHPVLQLNTTSLSNSFLSSNSLHMKFELLKRSFDLNWLAQYARRLRDQRLGS